jgi:hypothetical protein
LLLTSHVAAAGDEDDKRTCLSSYVQAQAARQDGKLRASRQSLAQCGAATCPLLIRNDCVRWLREVDDALPTVVLSCTGPDGRDRADARVTMDGAAVATRLDGHAMPVDPGDHVFRFELPEGGSIEQRAVVREGEHDRAIAGAFPRVASTSTGTTPVPAAARPVPTAVWILGGVGAASLAVSAVFASLAWFARPGWFACNHSCSQDDVNSVKTRFAVADVTGGIAIAALGAAAWLYFTRPARAEATPPQIGVTVAPQGVIATWAKPF